MIPETRAELKTRILEMLGEPVIKVNIADKQLDNCIDDALQYWSEFHVDAQDRSFLKIQLTQNDIDRRYVELPESVMAVLDIIDPRTSSNISWMSFQYELMRDTMLGMSNANLGAGGNPIGSYVVARTYLAEISQQMRPKNQFNFRYHKHRVDIFADMAASYKAGDYMILEVMGYLYKESYNIWGDKALRKLAAAMAKKTWGLNLKKFSGVTLPSGVNLNGDAIYEDGVRDIEEAEEYIQSQQEPYGILIG